MTSLLVAPNPLPLLAFGVTVLAVLATGFARRRPGATARTIAATGLVVAAARSCDPGAMGLGAGWTPLFVAGALPFLALLPSAGEVAPALIASSVLGMAVLAWARHLFALFLGLELMSLPLYLLLARQSRERRTLEAALKYFFSGSLAAGLFLMGMALLYVSTGSFSLDQAVPARPAAQLALVLMGCAPLFKLAAFPLHFWLPDAYDAASPELASFMSTSVKAAGALMLLKLSVALGPDSYLTWILPAVGAATMTVANLLALRQDSLHRVLAYSSMAHAGTLILLAGTGGEGALSATAVYLWIYLFMNAGAWLVLRAGGLRRVSDLRGLSARRPILALLWAVVILSLAGIPPTGGFFAKLLVFLAALQADKPWAAAALALNGLLALGYYARLVREAFLEAAPKEAPAAETEPPRLVPILVCVCALGALWLGLWAPAAVGVEAWLK
ncbi:MAG TPA: proton-conducting transporter membrane subunit [Elusimicrobiota bacterium]|nr:proton-conducting transporter membrane subunit [Elusimicrobiota bacterium]